MVKPSPAILRAAARMAGLSLSFTEMKTLPDCGSVTPAASCDLAKAVAKLRSMPMPSPVDFISGDKTGSVPGQRAKGKTASFSSGERRVGKECVSKLRKRRSPLQKKKNK